MDSGRPLRDSPLLGLLSRRLQEELVAAASPFDLPAQEWLFREGDPGDRMYAIVSGRVRVVAERDGRPRVLTTLGPGAVLGELSVLTGEPRSASIQAVRDTELLEIDGERFAELLRQDPELGAGLARALAVRLQRGGSLEPSEAPVSVVAVVGGATGAADRLWRAFVTAFQELGTVRSLDGPPAEWADLWSFGRHLGELEHAHDTVLLRAELAHSDWSSFVVRQADRVLVVAEGSPPEIAFPEGVDLVFLRTPDVDEVANWTARTGARGHHVVTSPEEIEDGAHRIVRRVTGSSLGIVLSGGGARAFAHIGVLDVLAREGIVADRLGGCSMGAFVAAMAAFGWSPGRMLETCTVELARRAPFSDYTIPRYALIRARRAASMLQRLFGDTCIEQLRLPLYTVSADLVSSAMVVHRTGLVFEAVGASMAIPGLAPPVPRHASLLVDGGILNNLPVDIMAAGEAGPIVAVDVMRRLEGEGEAGEALRPTILETLSRATVLGSVGRAEANRELADVLISPDVQDVPLRGFRELARAVDAGRRAAEEALESGAKEAIEAARRRPSGAGRPTVSPAPLASA